MNGWLKIAGAACALVGAGLYAGFVTAELTESGVEVIVGASLFVIFSTSFLLSGWRYGLLAIPALLVAAYGAFFVLVSMWAAECPGCSYDNDMDRWPGIMLPLVIFGLALVMALAASLAGAATGLLVRHSSSSSESA